MEIWGSLFEGVLPLCLSFCDRSVGLTSVIPIALYFVFGGGDNFEVPWGSEVTSGVVPTKLNVRDLRGKPKDRNCLQAVRARICTGFST